MFNSIRHVWEMPRSSARGARDVIKSSRTAYYRLVMMT